MLSTDCAFLENELSDVERLFEKRAGTISHSFRFTDGKFQNDFVVDGEKFSFTEEANAENELLFKRYERRFAKLGLYKILSRKFGEKMPWGALTGIRPTKLAYSEIAEGRDYRDFFEKMEVKKENVELVARILKEQEGIYDTHEENCDLFLSLPFCPTKCSYCSFITAPIDKTRKLIPDYLDALEKEIERSAPLIRNLRSVYIGGGTPLVLETRGLERVLKATAKIRKIDCEYTVEAGRPDVFTREKLDLLRDYGVNRICINPQSFSNETLKKIGRKHTADDLYRAFEMAKEYSFVVNADLIAGLADETVEEFSFSVDEAIRMQADNITVHCLCLKVGSSLKEQCDFLSNPSVDEMVKWSREKLESAGYAPYYLYRQKYQVGNNENVGYTKKGKACVYNIDVMEETNDNLALGANAVSKKVDFKKGKIERFGSQKDLLTYLQKVDETIEKRKEFFLSR